MSQFSVNIWDNCNLLEIVSMPSSHGTHVASIAAANFPDNPDRNGVAPGAQVVSVSIGDGRLAGMETGKALCRAMSHGMRAEHYKVDLINMSYGEHSNWSSHGESTQHLLRKTPRRKKKKPQCELITFHLLLMLKYTINNPLEMMNY